MLNILTEFQQGFSVITVYTTSIITVLIQCQSQLNDTINDTYNILWTEGLSSEYEVVVWPVNRSKLRLFSRVIIQPIQYLQTARTRVVNIPQND